MSTTLPLALYVHIPWCVRKCPYCDFNSHAVQGDLPQAQYLDALRRDLEAELALLGAARPLQSIFIGGGTPSLFSGAGIARLLDDVRRCIPLVDGAEVTLEANPGTVDESNFAGYVAAGVNRLSIGVQSFSTVHLQALGRIHDGASAARAIDTARRAGFQRINVDLMHGLPGQSVADALSDLRRAVDAGVTHISWYQLTIEANTAFHRAPPALPDEDTLAQIEDDGVALLEAHGFDRYEVSAWCRAGERARHNINYWTFGDYLAIGAGAHGKVSSHQGGRLEIERYRKTRVPDDYLRDPSRRQQEQVSDEARIGEFMLNALRLREGVDEALFAERTGLPIDRIAATLDALRRRGLMQPGRIAATPLGWRYLDSLVETFVGAD